MANLILQHRWKKQPAYFADVDWSNALSRSLVVAWQTLGITVRNVAGPRGHMMWSTNAAETSTPVKMSVDAIGNVTHSTHDYAIPPGDDFDPIADSDDLTVVAWYRPTVGSARRILRRGKDGSGSGWSVAFGSSGSSVPIFEVILTSGGVAGVSATGTTDLSVKGGWIAGRLIQGTGVTVWANGVQEGSGSSTKTSLRSSTKGFAIAGKTGNVSEDLTGDHSYGFVGPIFIWKRALSDHELREFFWAPYQVFRPIKRRFHVHVEAGGGGGAGKPDHYYRMLRG